MRVRHQLDQRGGQIERAVELERADHAIPRKAVGGGRDGRIERRWVGQAGAAGSDTGRNLDRATFASRSRRREPGPAGAADAAFAPAFADRAQAGRRKRLGSVVPASKRWHGSIYCPVHGRTLARCRSAFRSCRDRGRVAPPGAAAVAALAARRGRPAHGRAARDHPDEAGAVDRLVESSRRRQRRARADLSESAARARRTRSGAPRAQCGRRGAAVVVGARVGTRSDRRSCSIRTICVAAPNSSGPT